MSRDGIRWIVGWGALASLFLLTSSLQAQPQGGEESGASEALQSTIDQYVAAYNSGQVDQVMDFWAENSDFVDIRGRFHEGRDLIAALFRRGFADNPGRKLQLKSASRKFLSPQVAMDDGILELTSPDGATTSGRYTVVWTSDDGKWRIRSARDIPIEVEPAEDSSQDPPLEALSWMVGKWQAKSEQYQIELTCDWTLEKRFLVQTFHVTSNEEDFRVVTYIGFDPAEAQFRSWFFDSRGGFGGGDWTRVEDVYQVNIGMVLPNGQFGSMIMMWEQVDADTATWRAVERMVAGEALPEAKQTYTRVK